MGEQVDARPYGFGICLDPAYVLHADPTEFPDEGRYFENAWCRWNGRRFTARDRNSAMCRLARVLVAAGAPDGTWQKLGQDGELTLCGGSLYELAKWTISETDRHGLRLVRYQERPDFVHGEAENALLVAEGYQDSPRPAEGHVSRYRDTKSGRFEQGRAAA